MCMWMSSRSRTNANRPASISARISDRPRSICRHSSAVSRPTFSSIRACASEPRISCSKSLRSNEIDSVNDSTRRSVWPANRPPHGLPATPVPPIGCRHLAHRCGIDSLSLGRHGDPCQSCRIRPPTSDNDAGPAVQKPRSAARSHEGPLRRNVRRFFPRLATPGKNEKLGLIPGRQTPDCRASEAMNLSTDVQVMRWLLWM